MAAVHLPQCLASLTPPIRHKEAQLFYYICRCTKDIVQPRFEDFVTLLYVFMNIVKVFVH